MHRHRLALFMGVIGTVLCLLGAVAAGKTYAINSISSAPGGCGINSRQNTDGAGLVVGFAAKDENGNWISPSDYNSVSIRVNTIAPSYSNSDGGFNSSGKGYYNLFAASGSGRTSGATFDAINKGDICGMGTSWYAILGTNNPTADTNGAEWQLDCDYSYRYEGIEGYAADPSNPFQQFDIIPHGTPSGIRTVNGAGQTGYWTVNAGSFTSGNQGLPFAPYNDTYDTSYQSGHISGSNPQEVAPANGYTASFVFVYHEPPPYTPPPGGGGSLKPAYTVPTCTTASAQDPGSIDYMSPSYSDSSGADTSGFSSYSTPLPSSTNGYTFSNGGTTSSWAGGYSSSTLVPSRTVVTITDNSGATLVSDVVGSNREGSGGTRHNGSLWLGDTWTYLPSGQHVHYKIEQQELLLTHLQVSGYPNSDASADVGYDGDPGDANYNSSKDNDSYYWVDYNIVSGDADNITNGNCFSASCSLSVVGNVPNGPSDGVESNQSYIVEATMTNGGGEDSNTPLPDTVGGYGFSLTDGTNPPSYVPNYIGGLDYPGSETFYLTLKAANSGSYTLSFYPDYYGNANMSGLGSACTATVDVYQQFDITPTANNPSGNQEDPTTITYSTSGTNSGATVNATAASCLTKQTIGSSTLTGCSSSVVDGIHSASHSYGTAGDGPFTYSPTSVEPGDTYCSHVTINPATGWVDSGGNVADGQPATADSGSCLIVNNEPYAHFFGADVDAGGGFGNNCTVSSGAIRTYSYDSPGSNQSGRGSGTQFGAQALNIIEGFDSASLRNSSMTPNAPTPSTGLTFANTSTSGTPPNATMGGSFAGTSYSSCVPDYYGSKPNNATAYSSISTTPGQYAYTSSGLSSFGGVTIRKGVSAAIYVTGDVYITGNVNYQGPGSWSNITDIPSFYLVVEGGNIYVAPGVTNLDGVYVAEPDPSTGKGGAINTCSTGAGSYDPTKGTDLLPAGLFTPNCGKQLTVHGAFVAQKVALDRAYSSLRYSSSGENPRDGKSNSCGSAGQDVPWGATTGPDCAAEIFDLSPELYLTQPAVKPSSGPTTGKFDYITSLSPVL